jgi:hypothetical protein
MMETLLLFAALFEDISILTTCFTSMLDVRGRQFAPYESPKDTAKTNENNRTQFAISCSLFFMDKSLSFDYCRLVVDKITVML